MRRILLAPLVVAALSSSIPMKRRTLQLDPLVQRKLAAPHAPLTPSESRECLISCIRHGKDAAAAASGKRCVVVLGNTGAGKSAFINLLAGCEDRGRAASL